MTHDRLQRRFGSFDFRTDAHESRAGEGVSGGKIMRDGLGISCVLHQRRKGDREGHRWPRPFIDMTVASLRNYVFVYRSAIAELSTSMMTL